MNRRWLLPIALAVAFAQIGVLVLMIAGRAAILRSGQEVMLSVEPIDPRDLLRGDYVILRYNISQISADLFEPRPQDAAQGKDSTVFVRLRAGDDGIWQAAAARAGQPLAQPAAEGEVDIRGTATSAWSDRTGAVFVRYGIERFYLPEGEGRAIENDLRQRPFRMKIAVARDGSAQIKSFHDGQTMLYAEPLY